MTTLGAQTRSAPVPAWSLACLATVLALAALAAAEGQPAAGGWKLALVPLFFALPGALIAGGRPDVPVGWLMLAVAVLIGGSAFGAQWGADAARPAAAWAVWWTDRFSAYAVPAALLALLLLPDGRLPGRGWRAVTSLTVGAQVLLVTAFCLVRGGAAGTDTTFTGASGTLDNPVGILPPRTADVATAVEPFLLSLPLLLVLVALVLRLRRGEPEERLRLVEILLAAGVFVVLAVLGRALWPAGADLLDTVGAAVLGVGVTTAVLRRRVPGLEVVLHRSFVYAVLTVLIATAYVAAVALLASRDVDLPPLGQGVLTAVIALTVLPVRGWLQRNLDRALYGDRRDPHAAVRRLDDRITDATSVQELLHGVAASTASALRVPWVRAELPGVSAVHGSRTAHAREVARGCPVGDDRRLTVTVGWPPGRRLASHDEVLLDTLTRQAGRTVTALLLATALLESRHALVTAREQERARLRRDLHDELGPTLAGLVMQLAGLRELLAESPEVAADRLPRLEGAARSALEDVRRVSRSLRPPALDELGLSGALRDHAARLGLRVHGASGDVPGLPAAVEVAAYRIGAEALTNVARHAGEGCAVLELGLTDRALRLSVADHGRGWSGERLGVGVLAMRERAEELGGRLDVETGPGSGTTVRALLPLGGADG